jgi:hypothetical protein
MVARLSWFRYQEAFGAAHETTHDHRHFPVELRFEAGKWLELSVRACFTKP